MSGAVVDTNVVLVSNCQHEGVSQDCIAICAQRLQTIMKEGKLVLDDCFRILIEYQNKTTPKTGNRAGDAFVKWALQNNANPQRVDLVELSDHPTRGYDSFPDDPALAAFDPADRKFVVSRAPIPASHRSSRRPTPNGSTGQRHLGVTASR